MSLPHECRRHGGVALDESRHCPPQREECKRQGTG